MTPSQQTVFFRIHSGLRREGPGSDQATERAFRSLGFSNPPRSILDVGCGTGAQTFALARLTGSDTEIVCVDTHQPFLDRIAAEAREQGLEDRVTPVNADMGALPFSEGCFDLIWSEAAAYIIGPERALRMWRPLLRPEGETGIGLSELSWIRDDTPEQLRTYWETAYPGIRSREQNAALFARSGYRLVESFVLPESAWWEYYGPIEEKLTGLEAEYRDDAEAGEVLAMEREEIETYREYSAYYGYVFFVARGD